MTEKENYKAFYRFYLKQFSAIDKFGFQKIGVYDNKKEFLGMLSYNTSRLSDKLYEDSFLDKCNALLKLHEIDKHEEGNH